MNLSRVPQPRSLPPGHRAAVRRLLEEMVGETPPRRRRHWWFSRTLVLVITGATVLMGGVAVALVAARPATEKHVVRCYSAAVLDEGEDFSGVTVARGRQGSPAEIDDAVATCAELWQQGVIVPGTPVAQEPRPAARASVPPLVACTLKSGVAAVFPGDVGTCARLGLPDLAPG
jgi:hypothetical protein